MKAARRSTRAMPPPIRCPHPAEFYLIWIKTRSEHKKQYVRFGLDLLSDEHRGHEGPQPEHGIAVDFSKQGTHGVRFEQSWAWYPSFVPCRVVQVVEPKLAGRLLHSVASRPVARSASTLTAATRPVSTIPAKPIITARSRDTTCRGARSP